MATKHANDAPVSACAVSARKARRRHLAAAPGLVLLLAAAAGSVRAALAILPVSDVPNAFSCCARVAADPRGRYIVVWSDLVEALSGVRARRFDATTGALGPSFEVSQRISAYSRPFAHVAADERGFTVAWNTFHNGPGPIVHVRPWLRRFDADGNAAFEERRIAIEGIGVTTVRGVATTATGRSLVLMDDGSQFGPSTARLSVVTFDEAGQRLGPPLRISRKNEAFRFFGGHIASARDGGFAVTWIATAAGSREGRLMVRTFDREGHSTGSARVLAPLSANRPPQIDLAASPNGGWIAAWHTGSSEIGSARLGGQLRLRLLDAKGRPVGAEIGVETSPLHPNDSAPSLAVSADGSFAVAWLHQLGTSGPEPARLLFQRFTADGRRLGPEQVLRSLANHSEAPSMAALPDGGYAVATTYAHLETTDTGSTVTSRIEAQRVPRARPGADACTFDGHRLACDTGHDAGLAETISFYASNDEDSPLFGALDGNGGDDFCLLREDRLRCDLDGNGDPMELVTRFPRPSPTATALLGDPDGEGRDDFCWLDGNRLSCDTAHDGGTAEVVLTFNISPSRGALGDLDGDGADEFCHVEGHSLGCDLGHDGAGDEITLELAFGEGESFFLADVDADGDDDPCFAGGGFFRCDTAHDGGAPELTVRFGSLTARPLIGDVDGI